MQLVPAHLQGMQLLATAETPSMLDLLDCSSRRCSLHLIGPGACPRSACTGAKLRHRAARAGFLSPASRGALMTAMLVMYLLLAVTAGFSSVWLWGMIHRSYEGWPGLAWRAAAYFTGISLAILTVLNVLIHHTGSSGSIPLGAFFSLIALWFLISIPLCFSGECRCRIWSGPFCMLALAPPPP